MQKPQVVIIAGGSNSRFFPFNESTHKGFISLLGKPLVIRQLLNLRDHGFTDIILVIHPSKNHESQILTLLKTYDLEDLNLTVVAQAEPKGMGDALLSAVEHINRSFAVLSPYHTHAGEILDRLLAISDRAVLVGTKTETPWDFGVFSLEGERLTGIVEKPEKGTEPSNLRVQSMYLLHQDFLEILAQTPDEEHSFETALDTLIKQEEVHYLVLDTPLPSLKYPWQLFDVVTLLFSEEKTQISNKATIAETAVIDDTHGPVIVAEGAKIGHASRIVGPAFIGNNAVVGDFALIRGSVLETGTQAGVHGDVARSILLDRASVHGSGFVGDSILGSGVRVGAGLITANKRFDRNGIQCQVKGTLVDTGLTSLGIIMGEDTQVGVGVRTMPGTMLGATSHVYPSVTVAHTHEKNSTITK